MPKGVELNKQNNVNVVSVLDMRLDEYAAVPLKTALDDLINAGQVYIVVDLAAVLGLSMEALQALTLALQSARRKQGEVRLASLNKQPADLIRASFPAPVFTTFGSVEEAVKSFQG